MAAYTTIDDPSAHFQTVLWTGNNAASRTITFDGNSDLQPDMIWNKSRSRVSGHLVHDSTRSFASNKSLNPDAVEEEGGDVALSSGTGTTAANGYVSAVTSDGFTVVEGSSDGELVNYMSGGSGITHVAWAWKANGGSTTTNDASATSVGLSLIHI